MHWRKLSFEQRTKTRIVLQEYIQEKIPGFEIIEKNQSLWMKTLSKILFFTPNFMDRFVTTFYPKIYVPSLARWESNNLSSIRTVAHEYVHLSDRKRLWLFFNFLYLSPQVFVVLALLFPLNPWFLLFSVCLLPLPSLGRAWAEFRGYRMTMAVHYWLMSEKYDIEHITHQFVSSNYYWMFPFRSYLDSIFNREFTKIKSDQLAPELLEIKNILTAAQVSVYNNLI
jgi:ABC-type multidrug transport system fused ATPase/permease subunit